MDRIKVLVTGADGQLGREIRDIANDYPKFLFIFFNRQALPIEQPNAVNAAFMKYRPAFCVNCAAYTAVDKAENDQLAAYSINATAVGILAENCREFSTRFVHISTDYVFDGNADHPLTEEDPTGPINIYGSSKLLGESLALNANVNTIILRSSWVYSAYGNNFVKTMIRLMGEREAIQVIEDQVGSPTYAADLAAAIIKIISSSVFKSGIYHYSNKGAISWFEFAMAIKEIIKSPCQVISIAGTQYPTAAKRPRYSNMDKSKIQRDYQVQILPWQERLEACIHKIEQ